MKHDTAHTPISTVKQFRGPDYSKCTFYLLIYKAICYGYPFGLHRLASQMSNHNISLYEENQKKKKTSNKHHYISPC